MGGSVETATVCQLAEYLRRRRVRTGGQGEPLPAPPPPAGDKRFDAIMAELVSIRETVQVQTRLASSRGLTNVLSHATTPLVNGAIVIPANPLRRMFGFYPLTTMGTIAPLGVGPTDPAGLLAGGTGGIPQIFTEEVWGTFVQQAWQIVQHSGSTWYWFEEIYVQSPNGVNPVTTLGG